MSCAEKVNKNCSIVVSIPHSGEEIPMEVGANMKKGVLLPSVDWYLPQLYDFLPGLGAKVIINPISRHVIDVNRGEMTGIGSPNQCLVYTKNTMGRDIYIKNPNRIEMKRRIDAYYKPYHDAVADALGEDAWLFDLHSFALGSDADIVLGTLDGRTMRDCHLDAIADIFAQNGFTVAKNAPFKGGHIIKRHKAEAVQIELNYRSYIACRSFGNEERPEIDKTLWNDCKMRLEKSFEAIIEYVTKINGPDRAGCTNV